jgi:2-phospho-L-lactate guanylyltransferase
MILIPVKGFKTAKQRLASLLSAQERSALARAMLEDVLCTLTKCSGGAPVALITSDAEVEETAARFGVATIDDHGASSETEAVAAAIRACIERGESSVLVIPGDIPLIEEGEVRAVFDALPDSSGAPGIVLVPAHDGRGTNAALLRPPGLLDLRFGNDSFEPHLRAAQDTGQPCHVIRLPGIGLDIDNPADLAQLLQVETRTESQKLLRSWNVPERLQSMDQSGLPQARRVTI